MCDTYYSPKTRLTNGKMLWFAVHEDEKQSYGKTMEKTKLIPVILFVTTYEDIKRYIGGVPIREILKDSIARILRDAKKQGGVLALVDAAVIYHLNYNTVSILVREYQNEHDVVLPYRGTIHDMGRAVTHKSRIVRMHKKKISPLDIARETNHSQKATDTYITDSERVEMMYNKGHTESDIAFATGLSESLVKEYITLIENLKDECK